MLKEGNNYTRKGNVVYENELSVYELTKCKFIDIDNLSLSAVRYMNRYTSMFPDNFKITKPKYKMRQSVIKLFFDFETTGLDWLKNAIHQMYFEIEVDGVIKEKVELKVRPHVLAIIEKSALDIAGVTEDEIMQYPPMEDVYNKLIKILSKYVNRFDKKDKMFLVGYNNKAFDDFFFRQFFKLNNDPYYGSWFWSHSLDVMCTATEYLLERRPNMINFKLKTVAKELGIDVDEEKLHDAAYDCELTRMVYMICTGLEIEM